VDDLIIEGDTEYHKNVFGDRINSMEVTANWMENKQEYYGKFLGSPDRVIRDTLRCVKHIMRDVSIRSVKLNFVGDQTNHLSNAWKYDPEDDETFTDTFSIK